MTLWGKPEDRDPTRPAQEPTGERQLSYERRVPADVPVADEPRGAARQAAAKTARERRHRVLARVTNAVDYVFALIYGLVAIRFALALMGANEAARFVQFMKQLTGPLFGAFDGIVETPPLEGGGFIDFPLLVAALVYALLHLAVRGLLRVLAGQPPVKTPVW